MIFVVPPNRLVEVGDDGLRLRRPKRGTIAPSIDLLLKSAAKVYGERLTAVILTGTGSDGSSGAWEVKQSGGTVVIENPETAMFPSMPALGLAVAGRCAGPISTRSPRSSSA